MQTKRSSLLIILTLVKLLKNLWFTMAIAVTAGVLGFILSFGISLFGTYAILSILPSTKDGLKNIFLGNFSTNFYFYGMFLCGFLRGVFHYLEQYSNHFIAFKILAEIRIKLFKVIRKLAPAKIDEKKHGDMVALLTADIELLEVFYAHTISPILIALFTSVVFFLYLCKLQVIYAFYMLFVQIFIGFIVPFLAMKNISESGISTRNKIAKINDEFLDNLRGIKEVIQYSQGKKIIKKIDKISLSLGESQKKLRNNMANIQIITDSTILFLSLIQILLSLFLVSKNLVSVETSILAATLQIGSFAPYINLANLGNILSQTFASAERVFNLMEENTSVENIDKFGKDKLNSNNKIDINFLSFKHKKSKNFILKNINLTVKKGELVGIMGESGCGKSTLLKLLMRFWDSQTGNIFVDSKNIKNIDLGDLYKQFNYMTQSSDLFIGTLRDNLLIAKPNASDEEIFSALKKASLYNYVLSLPKGLDSIVEESGKNFSGGEKQRIGLTRAFLADREIFLLDEPTSNLDIQNEAIILKSLIEEAKNKTIILVSHRESTLSICDRVFKMENGLLINY